MSLQQETTSHKRRTARTALAWAQALAPLLAALISAGWHIRF